MSKLFAGLAALAVIAAAPAAATYSNNDAFTSFNGINGNGGFTYGYTDSAVTTAFDTSTPVGCAINSATFCLHSSTSIIPQVSLGGGFSTVSVPSDALLFHPGDSATLSVYTSFEATEANSYNYVIDLKSVGHDTSDGIGYQTFTSLGGVVTLGAHGVLPTYLSSVTLTGTTALTVGESFGVIIDRNSNYNGDSTGVNFTIATVPEPATWGLMLAGFGMVGFAARRRTNSVAA